MSLSRRDVLKLSVAGGAAMALPLERALAGDLTLLNRLAESALPAPYTIPFKVPYEIKPVRSDAPTDYFRVSMEPFVAEVVPGLQTPLWGYNGMVPGPTFRVSRGRQAVVRMINNLPPVHPDLDYVPWTSVHLHGSASLPQYDGYASDISNPGQYKDYRYPNSQGRAPSGTTTTGSATRPRTSTRDWRGSTSCTTSWSRRCRSRTVTTTSR